MGDRASEEGKVKGREGQVHEVLMNPMEPANFIYKSDENPGKA